MPVNLPLQSPEQALTVWLAAFPKRSMQSEEIATIDALHRVTAEDIATDTPFPEFTRSGMDGYAVRAADTAGASEAHPVTLSLIGEAPMGSRPDFTVAAGEAALIHTGGMMPTGADAVVILEVTRLTADNRLEIFQPVKPGKEVSPIGEDVARGQVVIPAGTRIRAGEIGGLMALGRTKVKVLRKPTIGILSNGDEVVEPQVTPQIGQVRDINSYTASAHIEEWGGEPLRLGIISDDIDDQRQAIRAAYERCDAVLISAGSSASERDHTAQLIQELGQPGVLVHGINIKPGKPTILAACNGKPVIGLPGNPLSTLMILRFYVKPMVERLLGLPLDPFQPSIHATLTINLTSHDPRETWWPVRLVQTPEGVRADPVFYKSSLIFSYLPAQGLIKVPAGAGGLAVGSPVEVYLI
jgi:molybdopterin molybdotransferase